MTEIIFKCECGKEHLTAQEFWRHSWNNHSGKANFERIERDV